MERFELSFKNKAVRVWFYTVFPATIVAIILFLIFSYEQTRYVPLCLSLVKLCYLIWLAIYTRKKRK